jgi:integrase
LIALFTGARMSEILQLERSDVSEQENTWVISFDVSGVSDVDNNKRLKAAGSVRAVPVHSRLVKLGFIDFVKSKKGRIFDDEERNQKGKFDAYQKYFAQYRLKLGVGPKNDMEKCDFHSFRHTVRTRLTELKSTGKSSQRFDSGLIDSIIGHQSRDRGIGEEVYNHAQQIAAKKKALERLDYDAIDFDKLIAWQKCIFARAPYRKKAASKLKNK